MKKIIKTSLIISVFYVFCISLLNAQNSQAALTYKNKELGVELIGPEGWHMDVIREDKSGAIIVAFSQYLSSSGKYLPRITLSTEPVCRETGRTSLEFANSRLQMIKMALKESNTKDFKIIKEPKTVIINGKEDIHFIYEITVSKKIRNSVHIFKKGVIFYIIQYEDEPDNFDNNLKAFEIAINSFKLE